jgi:hypothetical protein
MRLVSTQKAIPIFLFHPSAVCIIWYKYIHSFFLCKVDVTAIQHIFRCLNFSAISWNYKLFIRLKWENCNTCCCNEYIYHFRVRCSCKQGILIITHKAYILIAYISVPTDASVLLLTSYFSLFNFCKTCSCA